MPSEGSLNLSARIREQSLLDALESLALEPYVGRLWRSVKEGRDPLACWRSGGRWDDGTFDVLYTSATRHVAIEERRFHLKQGQPIPPSKPQYELYELSIDLKAVFKLQNLTLQSLGLDLSNFGRLAYANASAEYPRSQDIAEACYFMGADGILVPSARAANEDNLVIFCDQMTGYSKSIVKNHGIINWR